MGDPRWSVELGGHGGADHAGDGTEGGEHAEDAHLVERWAPRRSNMTWMEIMIPSGYDIAIENGDL